jgi:hypothetical protein
MHSVPFFIELQYSVAMVLLIALAATMYLKGLHRHTPLFFAYALYASLSMTLTYTLLHFFNPYWGFYASWGDEAICLVLEFAIVVEIFKILFAPYSGIRRFAKLVMTWSAASLLTLGVFLCIFFRDVAFAIPALSIFEVLDRSLRAVQLGLIVSLFAVSKYLHVRWRNFAFGIAFGFGFYALMCFAGDTVRIYYGQLVAKTYSMISGAAYWAAILVWFSYALQPDVAHVPIIPLPSHELERWDRALAQLLGRTPSSTIPAGGQ